MMEEIRWRLSSLLSQWAADDTYKETTWTYIKPVAEVR